jgi:AcrR family transcriptional regulator
MQTATETKERILDAAERLFVERGFEGASLRAITGKATVNLAAVNYHFNSKEALIRAVVARRLGTINRRRLELLDELEAASPDGRVAVEDLVRAFIEPVVRLGENAGEHAGFQVIMARLYSAPTPTLLGAFAAELRGFATRFAAAFCRALPHLPEEVVYWRINFMVGAIVHTLAAAALVRLVSGGRCDPADVQTTVRQLTEFLSGGFNAGSRTSRRETHVPSRPGRNGRRRG